MKAFEKSEKEDLQVVALEAGLISLQSQRATTRCLQVVVRRRGELAAHSRSVLDAYLKIIEVPGYRPGKAPPERMLAIVAKIPKFERQMFRRCFGYWMELNAGLSDRVVEVGKKAAPGIEFGSAVWTEIADTADSIATRMPQHKREDILLALFASRFGPQILGPCLCENCATNGEEGVVENGEASNVAGSPDTELSDVEAVRGPFDTSGGAATVPSASPISVPSESHGRGHDNGPLESVRAALAELAAVDAQNPVWDDAFDGLLEELGTLRSSKLAQRRKRDLRAELDTLLARLSESTIAEELAFLKLRDTCQAWRAPLVADESLYDDLAGKITAFISDIEAHRAARIGAQQAGDDEQLETYTGQRRASKSAIVAMVADVGSTLSTPSPGGDPTIVTSAVRVPPAGRSSDGTDNANGTLADVRPATPGDGQAVEIDTAAEVEPFSQSSALEHRTHSPLPVVTVDERTSSNSRVIEEAQGERPAEHSVHSAPSSVVPKPPSAAQVLAHAEVTEHGREPVQQAPVTETPTKAATHTAARSAPFSPVAAKSSAPEHVDTRTEISTEINAAVTVPRTSTAELAVNALLELPLELSSYNQFREHFWTGPAQTVEPAPWRDPKFLDRLELTAAGALSEDPARTWELLTMCRALEALGRVPPVATSDLRAAASLWMAPDSATAGLDPERGERLRSGRALIGSAQQRIALLLEALRPSLERQLLSHEVDPLIEQADFQSGALRVVVQKFLTATAQGHDPTQLIRRLKRTADVQAQNVGPRLEVARKDLQAMMTRLWNAAGGKVQRTHCRHAWSEFVERIHSSLVRLYPPPRGDDTWSIAEVAKQVDAYASILEDTCDRFQAKFDDKRRMLRAAGEIADAARLVLDLKREQLTSSDERRPAFALPEIELEQLRSHPVEREDEEFGRRILLRAMGAPAAGAPHPLAITIRDLCGRPDLLRVIRDVPPESVEALRQPEGAVAYADDLPDPVRAAAIVMQPPEDATEPTLDNLVARLERTQRSALLGLLVQVVEERLQRRIHSERSEALGRLVAAVSRISQVVEEMRNLGNRFASAMRAVRDHAQQLIEQGDVRIDTRLIEAWLERVHEMGRGLVQGHVEQLSLEAAKRDDAEEIQHALSRAHYGRAIRLLQGHSGSEMRGTRQTEWRDEVEPNRDGLLRTVYGLSDPKLKKLIDAWRVGVKGDPVRADRTLRTEFVKVITEGRNMDKDDKSSFIAIPMASIQGELALAQLMPTFMPQLSRYPRLTILTPPVSPEQPSFKQNALSRFGEFQRDLVLLLTPRLPSGRRAEILSEMRHRRIAGAVFDDVDLIRLVNPGGQRPHQMLGTLEIALEQQRRGMFSPFDVPEGSHVRLEMYVGRQDKARELARTANFSRLFSGRKLGKSALLRYMESSEGGVKLPSGNALRVVYVPAVGIESEPAMVEAIVASLEAAAGVKLERPREGEPAEKLGVILNGYLASHRAESVLLVLDEADVFFERQLTEYEDRRERCLSFQMRSRFSALTDEQGLPRVRFVFAGYRVTNRSQGAWSNWGRVLSLDPLEPEDAARLISAPLAVMGIDIGAHAHEIAYRCGYQPAIILRFGERLVDHLERQPHRGEHYVVSDGDIAQTLEDSRVHEEIRTIARNNFEGNPVGLIVFSAFLRELLELPPGQPLSDAPQRIVDRLRKIDTDLSWLERDGDGSATVRTYLTDFVERSLLRKHRSEGEYSLRFPHHLTILASLADGARIRDELRRIRSRSEGTAELGERALVAPRVLRDLTEAAQPNSAAVAIVGTLWPTGTYEPLRGMPDRLGATPDETVDAQRVLDGAALSAVRVIRRTDVTTAELVVNETSSAPVRPVLVGGVDLLRWGIQRRKSSTDVLYEVHGVGRLSMPRLIWWFQRARGLEFARTDALERIHLRTGGIPMLLETVDNQLVSAAGTTVSDDRVNLALATLDDALPAIARELVTGRPSSALLPREREILQMIECVVRLDPSAGNDLSSALTELWELFADRCPFTPLSNSDAVALEVLLELGFLPAKTLSSWEDPLTRLGPIHPDDPIFKIVRAFSSERATN